MTVLRTRRVKTQKAHYCFGCNRKIPAKTECYYDVWVSYGDFCTGYICEDCEWVIDNCIQSNEEWYEGQLYDFLQEENIIQEDNRKEYVPGRLPQALGLGQEGGQGS